ncbi:hypothetical protein NSQ91_26575 [Paenibacillus sp. FSL R7-0048]|nr:hypothetical protein [Paenibacillus odorifer]
MALSDTAESATDDYNFALSDTAESAADDYTLALSDTVAPIRRIITLLDY